MKRLSSLALLIALLPLTANAQNIYPKKDLAFAQVAAGGAYETVINVTNRGPDTFYGVLRLFQSGQAQAGLPWSPLVNGNQIIGGTLNVTIFRGATATYRITRDGGTEVGFVVIMASEPLDLRSFLEGTLTYYVRDSGVLIDSVGVQPSSELYLTAIPFDDFSKLAMALANFNTAGVTVKLTVFSDANTQVATISQPLAAGEHMAKYLWQLFPSVQPIRGRLEIQSSGPPVTGTILTDIDGQLSSLPMQPAVKAYTFTGSLGGISFTGEISLWLDGLFVQGYIRVLTAGGVPEQNPDTMPLTGSLLNGVLYMITSGNPGAGDPLLVHSAIESFSLSRTTMQASSVAWWLDSRTLLGSGTLTMTAIN